jgi:antitoxin (DNA-binding transcriptional repressor) of toxin-antitoxin stability system
VTTGDYIDSVKAVGVRALKARLSEYLRLVKSGETILVTERDEVVAQLRPARHQAPGPSALADHLEALADRGEVRLRSEEPGTWTHPGLRSRVTSWTSGKALDALREESP